MRKRFHSLKIPKIRQDWSKWNLYNLSRQRPLLLGPKTYFQQKWAAKAATRAFHGEMMREKMWQRQFSKKFPAAITMNPQYIALNDGAEQAQGRGSGQDVEKKGKDTPKTPYMQMTYYPTERRLDVAVWRALFASSSRQARQLVVHGWVKVNGKKMQYPGYLLNPGDMFSVDPERVMFATGQKKENNHRSRNNEKQWAKLDRRISKSKGAEESTEAATETSTTAPAEDTNFDAKSTLKDLLASAKSILSASSSTDLSAKRKQDLRAFQTLVRSTLSKARTTTEETTLSLTQQLALIKSRLYPQTVTETSTTDETPEEKEQDALLSAALARLEENPRDASKPYLTPWRPRNYMSAFAFIPRYLEVNQNICAAVYLRHPVARPGLGEVPTPFSSETSQLAFNWYLRRR